MKRAALLLIAAYRTCISPLMPSVCRFEPSCSAYAEEALRRHGMARGSVYAARRLLRCHPWGPFGYDPVPETSPGGRSVPGRRRA